MSPSDITPEIIATKIFGWKYLFNNLWTPVNGTNLKFPRYLPTFLEPEWTGPLLIKATEIGQYYILVNGVNGICFQMFKHGDVLEGEHVDLNYAIAGAILEAMEK